MAAVISASVVIFELAAEFLGDGGVLDEDGMFAVAVG